MEYNGKRLKLDEMAGNLLSIKTERVDPTGDGMEWSTERRISDHSHDNGSTGNITVTQEALQVKSEAGDDYVSTSIRIDSNQREDHPDYQGPEASHSDTKNIPTEKPVPVQVFRSYFTESQDESQMDPSIKQETSSIDQSDSIDVSISSEASHCNSEVRSKMADSSDSEAEFEGFSADDLADYLPHDDSDIDVSDSCDTFSASDDEDSLPIGESQFRLEKEGGGGATGDGESGNGNGNTPTPRKWSKNLGPVSTVQFHQATGPTVTLNAGKKEIDFFNLIFTPDTYVLLTEQTNLYAKQSQEGRPDSKWVEVTTNEMKAFLGIHVLMSFIQLPTYKDYWTTTPLYRISSIPQIMTRVRFEKILQYFHCNNNRSNPKKGDPGHDKLHSIRPVLNVVQQNLKSNYGLHKNVAVDEAMIPFRGRLGYHQYLPGKSCKFGRKVWQLKDSSNGYVYEMQIYTGRSGTGLAPRVVTDLTRDLVGKNHHVYMDNFFSSPDLFRALLSDKIYAAGTVRTNRKGWPQQLHSKCLSKKDKGLSKALQDGNLVATCWMDNRQVNFLSTNSDPTAVVNMIRKQRDGTKIDIPAPKVVSNYHENMAGVAHGDQIRVEYPTCRRSKKYWKYVFWFLFDTALASAFILMKESPNHQLTSRRGKSKERTQLDFRKSIASALIGNYRQKRRYQVTITDQIGESHWPVKMQKARRCKQCGLSRIRKESKFGCTVCEVNLCVTCFEPFHTSQSKSC